MKRSARSDGDLVRRIGFTVLLLLSASAYAVPVSPLYLRGYTVIPEPQTVKLNDTDFQIDGSLRLEIGDGVNPADSALEDLREQLAQRYHISLGSGEQGRPVELAIRAKSVEIGAVADRDTASIAEQAYRLELNPSKIRITANASAGLFYGVQTLVQLMKQESGKLWLPEGEITDWPDVGLREVFWDELEHLDHFDVLQQAIRRAAFFKVNALALRLNGHFQYASAPALVDPYALSPSQLQALTDYGLHHHVQVIPYLDGPAHVNFILERDEYKKLREFPEMAFQMCSANAETYKLFEGMYQDLMNANKGVSYFHLSTDEAWFIGKAENDQCNEVSRAKELGSPSKLWVEYTKKTAGYLQNHGRKVIFWGEEPLQAEDIPLLPPGLINGEVYSAAYNRAFRARRIRQMIYTNSLPDDPLFPAYFVLPSGNQRHSDSLEERALQVFNEISWTSARSEADIAGAGVYAWGDLGPHPETFWMGYAVGASAAWHPGSPDPHELEESFYRLFYGQGTVNLGRVYQLMSTQAQFWTRSWDTKPSGELPLIFGYSYGIGPFVPEAQMLPLPDVPGPVFLQTTQNWARDNAKRIELTNNSLIENDELLNLLYTNLASVQFNRYNLEVYLSIAKLCRENLLMLKGLAEITASLERAQDQASHLHFSEATTALDQALDSGRRIRDDRNQALQDITTAWYKTWFPRVREANGRHVAREPQSFVDTRPGESARRRQEGLLYLIEREFMLPFGNWINQVQDVRNRYATAHGLAAREGKFEWQDVTILHSQPVDRSL
jgi:hexosaminidase